jgi:hypothetical protein
MSESLVYQRYISEKQNQVILYKFLRFIKLFDQTDQTDTVKSDLLAQEPIHICKSFNQIFIKDVSTQWCTFGSLCYLEITNNIYSNMYSLDQAL